jgi:hypothetical protein
MREGGSMMREGVNEEIPEMQRDKTLSWCVSVFHD